MSIPEPEVPLDHICSTIWGNTLYTFSTGAFQALPLKQGAKWEKLKSGTPVDGAQCVGTPTALWVVGGQSSEAGYTGLQKYTYSTGTWEVINAQEPVARNRKWHGAAYLPATDQIITYAGTVDGAQRNSDQTFTIRASAPYDVQAYPSGATPAQNPILLPWSDRQVVMVGGAAANTRVMLFSPETSWIDAGVTLAEPIPKDISVVKAIMVNGDDGSKNLMTFDLSEIPNKVNRMVLQGAGGAPVTISSAISGRDEGSRIALEHDADVTRRDLTVADWPSYNDTLAPLITRVNFAIAQNSDGIVVLAGGNPDISLSMFNVRENTWEDTSRAFASDQQVLSDDKSSTSRSAESTSASTSASSSSGASSTEASTLTTSTSISESILASSTGVSEASLVSVSASATATESGGVAVAAAAGGSGLNANAILGIVLGTITAAMILLGLALFCLRRKRIQRQNLESGNLARAASSARVREKGQPSEFAKEIAVGGDDELRSPASPPSRSHFRGHEPSNSQSSFSSMAILMGQINGHKNGHGKKQSTASSMFGKGFKSSISKPMPQMDDHPTLQNEGRSLTGDEKGVSFAANAGGQPRPGPPPGVASDPDALRRSSGWNRYWSGGSALNVLGFGGQKRMTTDSDQSSHYSNRNRITQDSATVPPLNFEGRPQMNRVMSGSPTVSNYPNKFRLDPEMSGKIERPVSAASSGYSSGVPESVRETWDPLSDKKPWGTERAPSSAYSESFYHPTSLAPSSRQPPPPPPVPDGLSKQPQLAMATTSTDMSWLNLGDYHKSNGGYDANESRV
ncbi:hypothetical protein HYQ44_013377 [Verticillium longisporum]|nr:hypothetical protein HYQ44_013377 [Verticillium longisporum]